MSGDSATVFTNASATGPTVISAGPNGQPYLEFEGGSDGVTGSENFFDFSEFTIFAVVAGIPYDDSGWIFADYGDNSRLFYMGVPNADSYSALIRDAGAVHTMTVFAPNPPDVDGPEGRAWTLLAVKMSGQTLSVYEAGVLQQAQTNTSYDVSTTFQAGTTPTIGAFPGLDMVRFNGGIAEFIVYQQALSDDDRRAVEWFLADKYGVPGGPSRGTVITIR